MHLSKERYTRKGIHNDCSVRIENSVTQDNCSASLGESRDAKQLPSWRNFQSAPLSDTIKENLVVTGFAVFIIL